MKSEVAKEQTRVTINIVDSFNQIMTLLLFNLGRLLLSFDL